MNKIYRTSEYFKYSDMVNDLIINIKLDSMNESIEENVPDNKKMEILNKIISDLKLNVELVGLFGVGITAFYPIVESLIKKMSLNSSDMNIDDRTIILMIICTITVIYQEEKKNKLNVDMKKLKSDSKSIQEELHLNIGVKSETLKKFRDIFYIVKEVFIKIFNNFISKFMNRTGAIINSFIDIFSYTSILIPFMNAVDIIVGKYSITVDTFVESFNGLLIGVSTIVSKHLLIDLFKKLKSKILIKMKSLRGEYTSEYDAIDDYIVNGDFNIDDIIDNNVIKNVKIKKSDEFGDKVYGSDYDDSEIIKES